MEFAIDFAIYETEKRYVVKDLLQQYEMVSQRIEEADMNTKEFKELVKQKQSVLQQMLKVSKFLYSL
jgi:hypothetical protein